MSLVVRYRNDDNEYVVADDRLRAVTLALVTNAEEGTVGSSRILFDDELGTFSVRGHRGVAVSESSIDWESDPGGGIVWSGYTYIREVSRVEQQAFALTTGRWWAISLVDLNTVLERRILLGDDADRPAETDVERIQWLAATNEALLIDDTTYLSTADPVAMDAADYRKQRLRDVLDDCAQQSGKNWYLTWVRTEGGAEFEIEFSLWYGHDDLETFSSAITITNDPADTVDDVTTFRPSLDSTLRRDPSRVYSGVVLDYDGGYVYVTREATATDFALGGRDTTMSAPNVKTKAKAKARAERYLRDIATEEDVISTAIQVTGPQLNAVMAGMRVQAKFVHLPGHTTTSWYRVMTRTIRHISPGNTEAGVNDKYELALELATPVPAESSGGASVYALLERSQGPYWGENALVRWGDAERIPTVGPITINSDSHPWENTGFTVNGTGTIDVTFGASVVGVWGGGTTTVIWQIRKNGVAVASESSVDTFGGLTGRTDYATVSVSGLAVADGDVITAHITPTPVPHFFRTPSGVGTLNEKLEITGGSLS